MLDLKRGIHSDHLNFLSSKLYFLEVMSFMRTDRLFSKGLMEFNKLEIASTTRLLKKSLLDRKVK